MAPEKRDFPILPFDAVLAQVIEAAKKVFDTWKLEWPDASC